MSHKIFVRHWLSLSRECRKNVKFQSKNNKIKIHISIDLQAFNVGACAHTILSQKKKNKNVFMCCCGSLWIKNRNDTRTTCNSWSYFIVLLDVCFCVCIYNINWSYVWVVLNVWRRQRIDCWCAKHLNTMAGHMLCERKFSFCIFYFFLFLGFDSKTETLELKKKKTKKKIKSWKCFEWKTTKKWKIEENSLIR